MTENKIVLASDHAGFDYKQELLTFLKNKGYLVLDFGTTSKDSVDYPLFAKDVCEHLKNFPKDKGILLCGTGLGMSMAANRYTHIRAAVCHTEYEALSARSHNNANVLCIGTRVLGIGQTLAVLNAFLHTSFEGGRHQRRLEQFCL
ncbi:MAG TPA: ribose 5-phosphate isomerase B [Alphaproteobacteria bacterium]|nr:ribose 5-phosphate isomerase B [Alphaproteobacteria bacterium]